MSRFTVSTRRRVIVAASTFLATLVVACSSATTSGSGEAKARIDPTRMDSTELWGHGYGSVLEAIVARRSDWMNPTGSQKRVSSLQAPVVGIFFEGQRQPLDRDYLKTLKPEELKSLRRIAPSESLVTYGLDWPWGAIVMTRAK